MPTRTRPARAPTVHRKKARRWPPPVRPESWSSDRRVRELPVSRGGHRAQHRRSRRGDFFNYAGLFRVREGELGLGACLVVGEQRHRWGGAGVQRQAGSTCAGAAVAGRWNGMDACAMRRISTAGARADPAVRGDVSGTPAGGAGWFGLAVLCRGGGGGRWAVAASCWRSSMGAASRDGRLSAAFMDHLGLGRSSQRCTDPGSAPTCCRRAHYNQIKCA